MILHKEDPMRVRKKMKYIHEGKYVAAVEVELVEDETSWSPYLSVEEAYKLDGVREALRNGDLAIAADSLGSIEI